MTNVWLYVNTHTVNLITQWWHYTANKLHTHIHTPIQTYSNVGCLRFKDGAQNSSSAASESRREFSPETCGARTHVETAHMWLTLKAGGSGILERISYLLLTGSSLKGSRPPRSLAPSPPCCGTSPAAPYSWAPAQIDATEDQFTVQHITKMHTRLHAAEREQETHRETRVEEGQQLGATKELSKGEEFLLTEEEMLRTWRWGGWLCEENSVRRWGWGGEHVCVRRWVWEDGDGEVRICEEIGVSMWRWGGECKEMRKLGWGSDSQEQGLKGKHGRWDSKGVKVRRWTSGPLPQPPSDCCPATPGRCGRGLSSCGQKKMAEKFIFPIHNFPNTCFFISLCVCVRVCVRAHVCKHMCINVSECVFSILQSENQIMHFAGKVRTFLKEWEHCGRSNSSCSLANSCCCHGYMVGATSEEKRCGNCGGTILIQPAA